ncbi:hypothetical protein ACSBR2_023540 [Camellia fascicularis]
MADPAKAMAGVEEKWEINTSQKEGEGDVLSESTEEMKIVTELTSKAMAKSLNLEENCFLKQFGKRLIVQARFNYYSKCWRPDLILGLKPHIDGSGYTMILQDEVGLRVFNNEKCYTVPKIPHAFFILMGDQMEVKIYINSLTA